MVTIPCHVTLPLLFPRGVASIVVLVFVVLKIYKPNSISRFYTFNLTRKKTTTDTCIHRKK